MNLSFQSERRLVTAAKLGITACKELLQKLLFLLVPFWCCCLPTEQKVQVCAHYGLPWVTLNGDGPCVGLAG